MSVPHLKKVYTRYATASLLVLLGIGLVFNSALNAQAGTLTQVSDTLSTSAPSIASDHTIVFTTATIIPVSGIISIVPQAGAFTIPAGLDFTDVDFAVNSSEKLVSNTTGSGAGSQIAMDATAGTSGFIRFTLNDTDSIAGGSIIRIKIGTNATHTVTGDTAITNPSTLGSYNITITTTNSGATVIDSRQFQVAIVDPVNVNTTDSTVSTPTMSPATSSFIGSVDVTLSTTTSGASIYYTTNGTTPTASSTLYTTQLTFTATTTLKAIAIKAGMNNSAVASETYTKTTTSPPPSGGGGGGGGNYSLPGIQPPAVPPSIVPPEKDISCNERKGDLNCDGRVNLPDLSILLYNWGTVRNNQRADINKDGKVTIADFSILLYFWTD